MFAFILALLFGAAQIYFTIRMILVQAKGDKKTFRIILSSKFLAYVLAVAIVMIKFLSLLSVCLCGFIAGAALSAIAFCVYKLFFTS